MKSYKQIITVMSDNDRVCFYVDHPGFFIETYIKNIGWVNNDDEPVTNPHILDAIRHYRPDYPIEEATK
jgi:hypothetical protein